MIEKFYSKKEFKKINNMRKRVSRLSVSDNPYQDSILTLAKKEDEYRNLLKKHNLPDEAVCELANMYSYEVLKKIEAEKEKWQDGLTGLKNKRAFLTEVPELLGLAKRNGKNVAMLMLDIDYFKKINDEMGHFVGDQALKKIADIIRKSIRKSDFLYRFGGEEFVVLLMNTNIIDAYNVAEKIRKRIEMESITVLDNNENRIVLKKTFSIGCSSTDQFVSWKKNIKCDCKSITEELFKKADIATYFSKVNGKNQTTIYSDSIK